MVKEIEHYGSSYSDIDQPLGSIIKIGNGASCFYIAATMDGCTFINTIDNATNIVPNKPPLELPSGEIDGFMRSKSELNISEAMRKLLIDEQVPAEFWSLASREISRALRRATVDAVKRPRWRDRFQSGNEEFAQMTAPEFLKTVWADQIGADGYIEKSIVRERDKDLMADVESYISTRTRRNRDLGDANGLNLHTDRPTSADSKNWTTADIKKSRLG